LTNAELAINRQIVEMRDVQKLVFREIGQRLGMSEEQARGRYRRFAPHIHLGNPIPQPPPPEEQEPELPTLESLSREERERRERQHRDRLFKELLQQRSMTDSIVDAILGALPRIPERKIERLPVPHLAAEEGQEQVGLLMFSDLHIGAAVDHEETGGFGEYNYPVFRRRLDALRDAVRSITLRERHFGPVNKLVVASLGDVIEGDDIFPSQSQQIDMDLTEQFISAVNDIARFLVELLDTYETIFVPCVTGNHGRIGRKGQRKRHINWDYLVGHMLQAKLEAYSDRITIEVPKSPFTVVDILGFKFLLRHGDGIKSWMGLPYYGISRSVGRWTAIQASTGDRFDYMLMGHFHQVATLPFTASEVLVNGSFPGTTEFSVEVLESLAKPAQVFAFVHPRYGLAARYPVMLDRPPRG